MSILLSLISLPFQLLLLALAHTQACTCTHKLTFHTTSHLPNICVYIVFILFSLCSCNYVLRYNSLTLDIFCQYFWFVFIVFSVLIISSTLNYTLDMWIYSEGAQHISYSYQFFTFLKNSIPEPSDLPQFGLVAV